VQPRWDGDVRGRGIADGRRFSGELDEFNRIITSPGWVTEEPEAHLLPHLQTACARPTADFALESSEVNPDGTLSVTLGLRDKRGAGEIRAALFALLGQVAETATYVRERRKAGNATDVVFDVVTGIPPADGPFATHGHLLRFLIRPATDP
jgi:hypothetical protein